MNYSPQRLSPSQCHKTKKGIANSCLNHVGPNVDILTPTYNILKTDINRKIKYDRVDYRYVDEIWKSELKKKKKSASFVYGRSIFLSYIKSCV